MGASRWDRALLVLVALICLAGLLDAWVIGEPDLAALFGLALALVLVLVFRTLAVRRPLRIRTDLARWLAQRSDITGEDAGRIADRALASYRLQLGEEPRRTGQHEGG